MGNRDEDRAQAGGTTALPWGNRTSIYEHLRRHLGDGDVGLSPDGQTLPDEGQQDAGALRWAAGALDGVMSHHMGAPSDPQVQVQHIAQAMYATVRSAVENKRDDATEATLYSLLRETRALQIVDALSERVVEDRAVSPGALHAWARRMVTTVPDREPLKIAIALLGLVAIPDDEDLLLTVGAHDEFALFAGVAVLQSQPDPVPALWRLCRRVHGWGRIHLIERLAQHDPLPDAVRRWLMTDGYRNDVMIEYTALQCAIAGRLHEALHAGPVDDAILDGAGQILGALLTTGGPAATLDDYEQGAAVLPLFLGHIERRPPRLLDFGAVCSLRDWLIDDEAWPEHEARGYQTAWRDDLRSRCAAFLSRPAFVPLAQQGLQSDDRQSFFQAEQAAQSLGIDTFEAHFARLIGRQSQHRNHYFALMQDPSPERIDRVLQFAEQDLDLPSIATGPRNEVGMGPEFQQHNALDFVLQSLGRWPGRGTSFVRAGLRSPTVRNRNLAISTLQAWPRASWPTDALPLLNQALAEEPDAAVRDRIAELLRAE